MAEQYEVKVKVGEAEIEVRGAQDGVVAIVEALSKVLAPGPSPAGGSQRDSGGGSRRPAPERRSVDARTLFAEKAPSTQKEALAVAAYYLAELAPEEMRSPTIDAKNAQEVFRHAKWKLPKVMRQLLIDASKAGYLDRVGPGEYKLNPVGFNLVEHSLGQHD
jgi:hypothetical protein